MKKILSQAALAGCLVLIAACGSSSSNAKNNIAGIYAGEEENEYDYFRDTLEIRPNDQGKFDITRKHWSSAKKDDPQRPVNKIAGQWNKGKTETVVAEFQASDTSLRITEAFTGRLRILSFDLRNGKLKYTGFDGSQATYSRVEE